MAIGLVGRKCGMTRVFTDAGESVPVTVVEVLPNRVTQVREPGRDGYRAVQVTYGAKRPQLLSKAEAGHFAKANVAPGKALVEFRLAEGEGADLKPGATISAACRPRTASRCRTARRARSASARRRAVCFPASACLATWALCAAPRKT